MKKFFIILDDDCQPRIVEGEPITIDEIPWAYDLFIHRDFVFQNQWNVSTSSLGMKIAIGLNRDDAIIQAAKRLKPKFSNVDEYTNGLRKNIDRINNIVATQMIEPIDNSPTGVEIFGDQN